MTGNQGVVLDVKFLSDGSEGIIQMRARYEADIEELWSALTEPQRLAQWYGSFTGNLRLGGEFKAVIPSSGWDGRGRVDICEPPLRVSVTMWEEETPKQPLEAKLVADGDHTVLELEKRGVSSDLLWAYGCGWQAHLEDLAAHLAGAESLDLAVTWNARFDELEPHYRAMKVTPQAR